MAASITEFEKALAQLKIALNLWNSDADEETKAALRDAVIQRFEFSVELTWKSSIKKLGLSTLAPKPAVREMAQSGFISDIQAWFGFIEARNKSSYTYAEAIARQVMNIVPHFVLQAEDLLKKLKV